MDKTFSDELIEANTYVRAESLQFRNVKTNVNIRVTVIMAEIGQKMKDFFKLLGDREVPNYMTRVSITDVGAEDYGAVEVTDAMRERYGIITSVMNLKANDDTLEEAMTSFEAIKEAISSGLQIMYIVETVSGAEWPYEEIQ